MKLYLFKLQPLAPFYFGSERNFGTGEDSDYFARSRQYPQQTTLLGVLRFKLLEAAGELAPNYGGRLQPEAENWVGPKSFDAGKPHDRGQFGKIGGITPLFLLDGSGKCYLPGHLDGYDDLPFQLIEVKGQSALVKISETNTLLKTALPQLNHYNHKRLREPFWVCEDGTTRKSTEIFQEVHQVGVFKLHGRGKESRKKFLDGDDQKGFFKKTSWSFKNQHAGECFACGVWLADDGAKTLGDFLAEKTNGITEIGGERSPFRISLEAEPKALFDHWNHKAFFPTGNPPNLVKVVLLSDAFAGMNLNQLADYAFAELVDFRNIRTQNTTNNYFSISNKENGNTSVSKSGKLNLFAAGSVFYVHKARLDQFRSELIKPEAFRQIGYNYFMEIENDKIISFFKP